MPSEPFLDDSQTDSRQRAARAAAVVLAEGLTPGERAYERIRHRLGFTLAPLGFLAVWLWPFGSLAPEAHRLAAIMLAVVVLWVTEALPLPVTALGGAVACVVLQVADARTVFAPFAEPMMFLFIGSFMLARAIFLHGVDRRLAYGVLSLSWVGARPGRILVIYGAVAAAISGWISNTATTAMMFPIGLSIVAALCGSDRGAGARSVPRYATAMMLMTTFAASIGGLATPVGTPPNLIGRGQIEQTTGVAISFFAWGLVGVPVVALMFAVLAGYLEFVSRGTAGKGSELVRRLAGERAALGPWTRGQVSTVIAFSVTVLMWIIPGAVALGAGQESASYRWLAAHLPESIVALAGALLLFVLPGARGRRALAWHEAVQIDWGVVLLYGGGLALGALSQTTGLVDAIGRGVADWLPQHNGAVLLAAGTVAAMLVSELTSNIASATIVVPLVGAVARQIGADPLEPMLGATLGASLGFMLPVSTPCNAIVYGSGLVPLARMVRYGLVLDLAGAAVVVAVVRVMGPLFR